MTKDNLDCPASPVSDVRLIRGDAIVLEPVKWLWPGYLPAGMLAILGGAPGCGKTTLAMSIAATVTRGSDWPDGSRCTTPGDVVIWSGEDAKTVLAARLLAAGADMKRIYFVDAVEINSEEPISFDPARDMELLEATAQRLDSARLLILDPIVSAVTADSHKNSDVRRALQPIVDLAGRLGMNVLGITHFTKGTAGGDPVERITGSLAFGAVARVVLVAAKPRAQPGEDEAAPRMFVRAKSNIGPDDGGFEYELLRKEVAPNVEGQYVVWKESLEGSARVLLGEAEAAVQNRGEDVDDAPTATDEAMEFLRDVLRARPMLGRDVKSLMLKEGFTSKTTRAARERLHVIASRSGYGADTITMWSLPVVPLSASRALPAEHEEQGTTGRDCMQGMTEGADVVTNVPTQLAASSMQLVLVNGLPTCSAGGGSNGAGFEDAAAIEDSEVL